ncbi:MAG: PP2C family protein-serine/threonine phosphatase [Bernardetiaceae bacterium]
MRFCFFLWMILGCNLANAQTQLVVQNTAGEPVADAKITFDDLPKAVVSDATGKAMLPIRLSERPKKVEIYQNKLYLVKDWQWISEKNELLVQLKKQTYNYQVRVQTAKGKPVTFGQQVAIEGHPEWGTEATDDFGLVIFSIPKDVKMDEACRFIVNGMLVHPTNTRVSRSEATLILDAEQQFRVISFTDKQPLIAERVWLRNKEYATNAQGIFEGQPGSYTADDFKIKDYKVLRIEEQAKGWQVVVQPIAEANTEVSQPTPDEELPAQTEEETTLPEEYEYDTIQVQDDFTLILEGLEIEKQYLIESSTELRAKIEYLNVRLSTDTLSLAQQEEIRKYVLDLERTLIQNELAYQEAQMRTREVIEEMKEKLNAKDSINTLVSEKVATIEAEKERAEQEFQKKFLATVGGLAVMGLIALVLLGLSRKLQKQRNELTKVTDALETKVIELNKERKKVELQADHLQVMNTEISDKNAKMLDSIRYAQTIQASILPSLFQMRRILPQFFVIYKPKDIVSGDFYWFSHLIGKDGKGRTFLAAVDCTGHGVPGAFMSIVGNDLLNEIINQKVVHDTAQILTLLNTGIHKRFKQSEYLNNDSMDISLCAIEKRDGQFVVIFSGAKRPLYHYSAATKQIRKLRGDLKSVGGRHKKPPIFTKEEILVAEGDAIYLTTDGYADQNGMDDKKLGTIRLEEKITQIAELPMKQQRQALEEFLTQHQGDKEQRDDITILGVRF